MLGMNETKIKAERARLDLVAHLCDKTLSSARRKSEGKQPVNGKESRVMLRRGYRLVCTLLSLVDFLERGVHAGIACLFTIEAGAPRSEVKVLSQCLSYRCRERAILFFFLFFLFFLPPSPRLSRHRGAVAALSLADAKKETPRREREWMLK